MSQGRINKLFGTDGSVMVSLFADFPSDFSWKDTPLFVTIDELEVPLWCEKFERRGVSSAVVEFADFDTERRAEELLGKEFYLKEDGSSEDEDEFYMEDLIGFSIEGVEMDLEGGQHPFQGEVTDYFDSDVNPLFEIEVNERRILIPAVEDFIAHIDFEQQQMKIVLPEGLMDLEQ